MNIKQISTILIILLLSSTNTYPSDGKISGLVTDGTTHLRGARVRVKATPIFALTNSTGRFTLEGIVSSDTLVVTAWAEGYYNGEIHAVAGDTDVVIRLHPLPAEDNRNYQWRSPEPDSAEELRCSNCHAEVFISQWRNNAHGWSACQ